jgi:hypothetical protein
METPAPADHSSTLDRRFLLGGLAGVAGIAALSRLASAGPLTPPAGAITPTGKTLDELYNRIPAAAAFEGRTPIAGGAVSSTVNISTPGAYVLTGNLTVTGAHGIQINADNVDLDLNGFVVSGPAGEFSGVLLNGPRRNTRIRNGVLREWSNGLVSFNAVGSVLEDLRIERCRYTSIGLYAATGGVVRRCTATDTGATTTAADGSPVNAIIAYGNGNTIDSCTVSRVLTNGVAGLWGINVGIAGSVGNIVSNCTVTSPSAISAVGIDITGSGVYRNCTVSNFSIPYANGTNGGGNF